MEESWSNRLTQLFIRHVHFVVAKLYVLNIEVYFYVEVIIINRAQILGGSTDHFDNPEGMGVLPLISIESGFYSEFLL